MKIAISNVYLDLGAGRRGTDMGPSAMYVAGLHDRLQRLGHEIAEVTNIGQVSMEANEVGNPHARFLPVIHSVCSELADNVEKQVGSGMFPLVLGGDHAQAMGTISGLTRHYKARGEKLGVFWVDAHADMNTPDTSPSGNIHGMPLAAMLGYGCEELVKLAGDEPALDAENVVIFGARDVDPTEVELVEKTGVRVYTMSEIDYRGMRTCLDEAMEIVTSGTCGVHLSFDLDGVNPEDAPGVGTPVPGGLTLRESHLICETLAKSEKLVGMEMVELNPTLDTRNKTGQLAVWFIESAMGRDILAPDARAGQFSR